MKWVHAEMVNKNSKLKLIYVTPEKIAKSKMFMSRLEKAYEARRLTRIAVDEVHCCSQWGHDFRPGMCVASRKLLGATDDFLTQVYVVEIPASINIIPFSSYYSFSLALIKGPKRQNLSCLSSLHRKSLV